MNHTSTLTVSHLQVTDALPVCSGWRLSRMCRNHWEKERQKWVKSKLDPFEFKVCPSKKPLWSQTTDCKQAQVLLRAPACFKAHSRRALLQLRDANASCERTSRTSELCGVGARKSWPLNPQKSANIHFVLCFMWWRPALASKIWTFLIFSA